MPRFKSTANVGACRTKWLLAATTFCLALLIAPAAPADRLTARDHHHRAMGRVAAEDFEGAIVEWKAAYALDPRPAFQLNIGRAYERMSRIPEALEAFRRYLKAARPSAARAEVEAHVAELDPGGPEAAAHSHDGGGHVPDGGAGWGGFEGAPAPGSAVPDGGVDGGVRLIGEGFTPLPELPPPTGTHGWMLIRRPWFWLTLGAAGALLIGLIDIAVVYGRPSVPDPSLGRVELR